MTVESRPSLFTGKPDGGASPPLDVPPTDDAPAGRDRWIAPGSPHTPPPTPGEIEAEIAARQARDARERWVARRTYMETHHEKRLPDGKRHSRRFPIFRFLINRFGTLLKLTGLYRRGERNAVDLRLKRMELAFDNLPAAFDGFTILHLSDMHIDGHAAAAERLIEMVDGLEADICVWTGDYRFDIQGPIDAVLAPIELLCRAITARLGTYAILGNHDTVGMVEPFERMGVRVLANETVTLAEGDDALHLTGIDDVHYFYTERALEALRAAPDGFRIALVHSPEIAFNAARAGVSLYLTGHTHGGQVCLPGGIPIITHTAQRRKFAAGLWRCGAMTGYTSHGAGTSGLPVRYFSRGEIALITLRRGHA